MELKLAAALLTLEHCIELDRQSTESNWAERQESLSRATATVQRLIRKASALDILSAKRDVARMLQPPAPEPKQNDEVTVA
jgi:hypothetical protein